MFIPILTVDGKVGGCMRYQDRFRKTEFKGGIGTAGVWLNGKFVWLRGYVKFGQ